MRGYREVIRLSFLCVCAHVCVCLWVMSFLTSLDTAGELERRQDSTGGVQSSTAKGRKTERKKKMQKDKERERRSLSHDQLHKVVKPSEFDSAWPCRRRKTTEEGGVEDRFSLFYQLDDWWELSASFLSICQWESDSLTHADALCTFWQVLLNISFFIKAGISQHQWVS